MAVLLRLHTPKQADNIRSSLQPAILQLLRCQPTAKDVISSCVNHDVGRLAGAGDNPADWRSRTKFRLTARLCRFRHGRTFSRLNSPGQVSTRREDAPLYASNPDSGTQEPVYRC
jgi:hypothetical protein